MFFCRSWPQKDLCSHVTGREGSGNAWRMISSAKLKSYGSELDLGISGKKWPKWNHSPLDFYQLWDLKPFLGGIRPFREIWISWGSKLVLLNDLFIISARPLWGWFDQFSLLIGRWSVFPGFQLHCPLRGSQTISMLRNFPYNNAFFWVGNSNIYI